MKKNTAKTVKTLVAGASVGMVGHMYKRHMLKEEGYVYNKTSKQWEKQVNPIFEGYEELVMQQKLATVDVVTGVIAFAVGAVIEYYNRRK